MTDAEGARLSVAAVDLSVLAAYLEQDDWSAGYLDPASGEIFPSHEGGEPLGPNGEPVDPEERGWISVGGEHDPRGAYQDMVDFARTVTDPVLRRTLETSLEGKGAFRRFRDAMYREADARNGRAWADYRQSRAQVRAIEWLVAQELVDDGDARQAIKAITAVPDGSEQRRLILLNGMPGVGKSTLAERYAADHPDTLLIDPDALAESLGDDRRGPAEAAQALSLELAKKHLDTGNDVVVPQLVARPDQLVRYENVARAARADFVLVFVVGTVAPHRVPVSAQRHLKKFRAGLADLRSTEDAASLTSRPEDIDGTYRDLLALLATGEVPT